MPNKHYESLGDPTLETVMLAVLAIWTKHGAIFEQLRSRMASTRAYRPPPRHEIV